MKKLILLLIVSTIIWENKSFAEGPTSGEVHFYLYSFCAPSICLDAFNIIQIKNNVTRSRLVPVLSLVIGGGMLYFGKRFYNVNPLYNDATLTYIGLGAGTMILSTWNLILKPKDMRTSLNVYNYSTGAKGVGFGLSLTHRF